MTSIKVATINDNANDSPVISQEELLRKDKVNGNTSISYGAASNGSDVEAGLSESMEQKASTISVHDINYKVSVKTKACCGRKELKQILKGVNGIFKPGMNAILGPTGSGKSSLLDILAGRKDPQGLTGELLIDGAPPPDNFKCMVGYVVQDDVVMGTLTVRENFMFSASLRLPSYVSARDRKQRVNQVIQELGLTGCADTKVGNEFIRGVSGGERKRTNIGMELIISPPVLFLDEPTTGLDANTANSVMVLLRSLALRGRTVVFSIHQPRFSIYRQFDSLTLLAAGEVVFHGPASKALEHFNNLGFVCEEHNNPPDFFLDVVNGDMVALGPELVNTLDLTDMQQKLVTGYKKSVWHRELQQELAPILQEHRRREETRTVVRKPPVRYATSFCRQLGVVCGRTVKNLVRSPQASILQLFVMLIFAVIVGAVYWRLDKSEKSGIQNRVGAFFFIVMNQVFGNLSSVELFIKERAIFLHENVSGFYRCSAYFAAKVFCDVIPMRLLPVMIFSAVVYFMVGLRLGADYFFIFALNLFLTTLAASSLAFIISASVRIFAVANLLIALCYVFMMLFSGLLVNLASVGEWLNWLKWLSIFRYSLDVLSINELKDQVFCEGSSSASCNNTGNTYLEFQGITYSTAWDLWQKEMALGIMIVLFLALTYIQLRRLKKLK